MVTKAANDTIGFIRRFDRKYYFTILGEQGKPMGINSPQFDSQLEAELWAENYCLEIAIERTLP